MSKDQETWKALTSLAGCALAIFVAICFISFVAGVIDAVVPN